MGWDPGARFVARCLARAFDAPLIEGRWNRLVADCNRSADHPRVIARRIRGREVPGNARLDAAARRARLDRYWRPYRQEVEAAARAAIARGVCLHLSVHSFVERLHGVERRQDLGLLFDPRRPHERRIVEALQGHLQAQGLTVRKNFPYFGHTDGMTSHLRGLLPASRYLGVEIEMNQRLARTPRGQRRLATALLAACRALLR